MNLILENTQQVSYFTEICSVLRALSISAAEYDWFVSDIETHYSIPGFFEEDQWISGSELDRLLSTQEIQFIWGVFSAVAKGSRPPIESTPYADGNPCYWEAENLKPQLNGALFEIVYWDSSATILIGISDAMVRNFKQIYPDAKPLLVVSQTNG